MFCILFVGTNKPYKNSSVLDVQKQKKNKEGNIIIDLPTC